MWWIQKNKKPEHGVQYNRSKVIKHDYYNDDFHFNVFYAYIFSMPTPLHNA